MVYMGTRSYEQALPIYRDGQISLRALAHFMGTTQESVARIIDKDVRTVQRDRASKNVMKHLQPLVYALQMLCELTHNDSREKKSFPCLYCGEEEFTASTEKFYNLRKNNQPRPPHTVFGVEVNLSRVLDLRTPDCCDQAGVNWNNINQPWEYHQDILDIPAYTQMLGMMSHKSRAIEFCSVSSGWGEQFPTTTPRGAECFD